MGQSREDLRTYVASNVVTVNEAAELLGVTRSHVTHLIRTEVLHPIKQSGSVSLLLKQDVIDYGNKSIDLERLLRPAIYDFSGREIWDFISQDPNFLKEVRWAKAYFNDWDAAIDGYYSVRDDYFGPLQQIDSPTLVLGLSSGLEIWTTSGNCGYFGHTPRQTEEILKSAGFPDRDLQLLYSSRYVEFGRGREPNAFPREKDEADDSRPFARAEAGIYFYKDHLVVAQTQRFASDALATLQEFSYFLPHPTEIRIYTYQQAIIENLVVPGNPYALGQPDVYRVIIKDASGREIWLSPLHRDFKNKLDVYSISSMRDILRLCEMEVPEGIEERWLHKLLRVIIPTAKDPIVISTKQK
ncbi:hypothetical protein LLE49_25895 [Alicyclobacillus tolerans]|uniref:helix-turn-helix domain-containing protein n=1 Tax=Alicyclobacillus tolerans TaxID=90970 RepID=UPI001F1AD8AC|nr:helix-turn-helix domain-containing protein [Alicyclobacillus tolerans]MCF8568162.1 hypothetical protein [Alicyclobacillus tolerans]